jgi:hypothetical protein
MIAVKEVTVWKVDYKQPNHVYLLDGDRIVAYIPWGEGEPVYSEHRSRIDRRGRKFVELKGKNNPFKKQVQSNLIRITGSKGDVYLVDPDAKTCTCTGFQFRHHCKHIEKALAA